MADDWRMDINTRAFHIVQQSIGGEPKKTMRLRLRSTTCTTTTAASIKRSA
jgi:hypothetical protein